LKVRVTFEHEASSRAAKGTYCIREVLVNGQMVKKRIREVGRILEGPDVHRLVGCGLAEPYSEDVKAMFTEEQVQIARETGHPMLMSKLAERVAEEKDAAIVAEIIGDEDDD
jgi:hypothetical protein